jgi:hypothetical protein
MEANFQDRLKTFFDNYSIFRSDVVSAINAGDQRMSDIKTTSLIVPSTQKAKKDETGKAKNSSGALLVNDKPKLVVKKVKKEKKEERKIPYFDSSD